MSENRCSKKGRWGAWDWDTTESIAALYGLDEDEDQPNEQKQVCPDCGGSGLSPYPEDGGSCPHCFDGFIKRLE